VDIRFVLRIPPRWLPPSSALAARHSDLWQAQTLSLHEGSVPFTRPPHRHSCRAAPWVGEVSKQATHPPPPIGQLIGQIPHNWTNRQHDVLDLPRGSAERGTVSFSRSPPRCAGRYRKNLWAKNLIDTRVDDRNPQPRPTRMAELPFLRYACESLKAEGQGPKRFCPSTRALAGSTRQIDQHFPGCTRPRRAYVDENRRSRLWQHLALPLGRGLGIAGGFPLWRYWRPGGQVK